MKMIDGPTAGRLGLADLGAGCRGIECVRRCQFICSLLSRAHVHWPPAILRSLFLSLPSKQQNHTLQKGTPTPLRPVRVTLISPSSLFFSFSHSRAGLGTHLAQTHPADHTPFLPAPPNPLFPEFNLNIRSYGCPLEQQGPHILLPRRRPGLGHRIRGKFARS